MIINKKIMRTIAENKSRYIGSLILILISCMLYISFNISGPSVKESVEAFRKEANVEDASFVVKKPVIDIASLEREYNVVIEERASHDYVLNDNRIIRIFRKTSKLNRFMVTAGEAPSEGQVMLDEAFAKAQGYNIGSAINIYGINYLISGYMTIPDYLYVLKSESDAVMTPDSFGICIMLDGDYKNITEYFTYYSVKFNEDNISEFKSRVNNDNLIIKWLASEDNSRISAFNGDVGAFIQIGRLIPPVILVLTCLIIAIVLWRLLKGEFVQIGTLYALGYRKSEILKHYLSYSLILSAAGSITGTIAGLFLAEPLVAFHKVQYNLPPVDVNFSMKHILMGLILPFAFLIPVTILVILKALRMSPLSLIRGGGNSVRIGFLERCLKLDKFKFNTKFKIREIVRNIPRTVLMVCGVCFASLLLLFGFASLDSIDGIIDEGYDSVYQYKYAYLFNTISTEDPAEGERFAVSAYTADISEGKKTDIKVYGVEPATGMMRLKDRRGLLISMDNVIITRPLADKLRLKENDTIKITSKLTGKEYTVTIDKITEAYTGYIIYMPVEKYNAAFGYPEGSYSGLLSQKALNIEPGRLISQTGKDEQIEGYKAAVKIMRYMVVVVGIMAFIIGLIIIYVVTSLIIEENRMNISLLKILGYSKKRIYSLMLNSNSILVITGYIIAVPLIIFLTGKMFESITAQMEIAIPSRLRQINILTGFVMIYLTYEISKLLSRRKVISISMAESLKNRAE